MLGVRAALALALVWGVLAPAVSASAPAGSGSVVVQGSGSPCSSSAVVDQSELLLVADCAVLWGVYSGLSDRGELDDEGPLRWGSGTVLGDWLGVTVTGGRVTALELSDADVAGALPASLASLSALVTLDLSWNGFSGEIPAALGSLSSLEVLRLHNNSLSGAVPSALGSLSSLRVLELRSNSLSGGVPSALGSLSSLEDLRLDSNNLSGSIPAELASLESLVHLDLWGNTLTGQIPAGLGSLASLETLVVAANELSGPIPAQLGMLGSLETLDASHNALSGPIPAQLGMLGSLEKLNLDHNMLSGAIPAELGTLGSLVRMSLAANDLSGPIPAQLGSLASLEILNLADNDLSGSIPAELGDLGSLVWLSVVNNDLTGLIPAELGAVASLRHLSLGANPLAWPPPESLSAPRAGLNVRLPAQWAPAAPAAVAATPGVDRLTVTWDAPADSAPYTVASYALYWRPAGTTARFARNVTTTTSATIAGLAGGRAYELFVTATNHTGTSPASTTITATPLETPCGQTATVDQTQALLVADCDALWALRRALTDATAVTTGTGAWDDTNAISTWTGVTVTNNRVTGLDLSATGVAGPVAAAVGSLTALTELDLSDNALTGDIPATVGSLTSLTELDLSFNTLTGPVPTQLGSLSSLEVLDLVANDLTGAIPTQLGSLTALTSLRVSGDGLTGAIPTQLGSLTALTELHIDGGGLTGAVPTQLGSLTSLTTLHIGGGSLTGAIPTQLGSLTALTSLYISGSGLSGTLPPELGALTSLETLWIKSDSLTGTVPARYGGLTSLDTLYLSGGALTGPVPAWLSSLTSLKRLYLHNNALTGPVPADLADLTTVWLSGNDLRGHIPPQTATAAALATLDVRDNPLSWPAPANLTDPPARLTALLPDTDTWVPPRPGNVTADAADASVTVTWDHPGAGDHFLVDTYTINYRPADQTGDHTQQAAAESPATITALTNATEYAIFVTATNTQGTSNPSLTVAATPSTTAQARTHDHTGAYSDSDDIAASAHEDAINALADWHIFDRTDCSTNPLKFCPDSDLPRWKLAVWLVRALDRLNADPDNNLNTFNDVNKRKWYKPFVERLRVLGVTTGCVRRSTIFCPNDTVTRAEMAVFLVRAFNIPSAGDAGFTDIDRGYWAYNQINALADADITRGCTSTTFCPEANTTNAEMAAFIHRACTNTNPVIARDCSPTDIDNGSTGGGGGGSGGGTTPTPTLRPTITSIDRGVQSLTVHWERATGDTRDIDGWLINYHQTTDPTTAGTKFYYMADPPASGIALTGLEHYTQYDITVQSFKSETTAITYHPASNTQQQRTLEAVRLVALEITQGLQNWNGDITLVKGKRTVVRAFLEPAAGESVITGVSLQLLGADGRFLDSVAPVNANLVATQFSPYNFVARADASDRREDINASVNFVLDDPLWVGEPGVGDLTRTLRLSVDPRADCREAIDPQTPCGAEVTFTGVEAPRVVVVPLRIGGRIPDDGSIVEHLRRIESLMPVPRVEPTIHSFIEPQFPPMPPDENAQRKASSDAIFAALDGVTDVEGVVVLGVGFETVRGSTWGFESYNGNSRRIARRLWWKISADTARAATGLFGRNTGSHEFGHLLGSGHAAYWDESDSRYEVVCSDQHEERATMEFPYLFPAPTDNMPATKATRALLGPTSPRDARVWGLDTRLFDDTEALKATLAMMDPSETYSIMSYCSKTGRKGHQERWVDEHFHQMFVDSLAQFDWDPALSGETTTDGGAGARGSAGPRGSVRDVLVVSGARTVGADGSADVVLSATYTYSTGASVRSQSSGDWTLELLDGEGAVLRSVPFTADTPIVEIDPDSDTGEGPSSELWRVVVPNPPAYSSYRIRQGQQTVAVSEVSAAAPTVSVTAPVAAQVFSGGSVSVSWTASDADGDDLVYYVHYSDDGGATYSTVGVGLTAATLVLPRDQLAGSTRARFRVIASDGTRSTTAQSPVFTVAQNAPTVIVHSPDDGRVYGGPGTVVLDATGLDTEDGVMADTALVWTSDIDGQIASSAAARINTGDLSAGTHVLTVTATDSSNMTASASATVTVKATNGAPAARSDTVYSRVGRTVAAHVLANDADPEGDIDPWSVGVVVPGALGVAAPAGSPDPGAVDYRAADTGVDVVIYEACDRFLQCSSAELVVVSLDDR